MSRLTDVCRWKTDPKIGRYLVPGCMGAAVYGESQCTCGRKVTTADRLEALESRVERLEAVIAALSSSAAGLSALADPSGGGKP